MTNLLINPFKHKPSLMCLCSDCTEYRSYYLTAQAINWANGSLLDGTLRVDRAAPKGLIMPAVEVWKNGLRAAGKDATKDVLFGVR